MANIIGELSVLLDAIIKPFTSKMDEAERAVQETARNIEKSTAGMGKGFDLASVAVGGFVGAISAQTLAKVAETIYGIGESIIKAGAAAETSKVAFTTLLGSVGEAERMLKGLQKFATETPFEFPELQGAARNMLAFGFAADKVEPMLRTIGDAVSALGGGAAEIDRVTRAFGQMRAKGKVSAEEMQQLAELGIPAWEMLAKAIGVSVPRAMQMAEDGSIKAGKAIDGMLKQMGEKFAGGMEAQSKTLSGMWSTLKDDFADLARVIGEQMVPAMKELVTAAGPVVKDLRFLLELYIKWKKEVEKPLKDSTLAMMTEQIHLQELGANVAVADIRKVGDAASAQTAKAMAAMAAAAAAGTLDLGKFEKAAGDGLAKVGKSASENKVFIDELTRAIRALFAKEHAKEVEETAKKWAIAIGGIGKAAVLAEARLKSLDEMLKDPSRPTDSFEAQQEEKPTVGMGADLEEMNAEIAGIPTGLSEADNNMLILTQSTQRGKEAVKDLQIQWKDFGKQTSEAAREVSTIMTDLNRDIAQAIVHWGGFKEAGTKALQAVGEMLVRMVIKNLVEASGLLGTVTKGVNVLLGGVGAGAQAASAVPSLIGGASAAGDLMSGVMGIGTKAGSAASKAASSGLTSIVGAVSGVVSAVSGVISNFQSMAMNKSLDLIEHNTRYSMIHLEYLLEKANEFWPYLQHINNTLWTPGAPGGGGGTQITVNYTGDVRSLAMMLLSELQRMGLRVSPA